MSVYTPLEFADVDTFLRRYNDLHVVRLTPTTTGIENSNFFVDARHDDATPVALVLTVFERMRDTELPYFAALLTHLQQAGLPVPAPLADRHGQQVQHLHEKPCVLVPRLPGRHVSPPNAAQCHAAAAGLARLHVAAAGFSLRRRSDFDIRWRNACRAQLDSSLDADALQLIDTQLQRWEWREHAAPALPRGVTHGDLFHDNALFENDTLTGIIDFYYACDDVLIYDLAIFINDWCNDANGNIDDERLQATLKGYESQRPLTGEENAALPDYLAFAALRFWLSRLMNARDPLKAGVTQKSPEAMQRLLLNRLARQGAATTR